MGFIFCLRHCLIPALYEEPPWKYVLALGIDQGNRAKSARTSIHNQLKETPMALHLQAAKQVQVNESDGDVDTHIDVRAGDTLIFHADGSIWSGVWFTNPNGPKGWNNRDLDPKFPLPGAHPFQLLGKLDTGYFPVGEYARLDQTSNQGRLYLRINDDVPGNGSGAFEVKVQCYRND